MASCLFACFGRRSSTANQTTKNNATNDTTTEEKGRGGPVLVELFSSQGCATSPEAELLVSRVGRGGFELGFEVIVMVYHVDYWDYMGWKDPFGSSQWTVRQKAYVEALRLDTMFTPQFVVQGRAQCVGNDENALLSTVGSAHRFPALTFQTSFEKPSPNTLKVSLTGSLRTKVDNHGANVMVGLYENGLLTDCSAGENKGRVLPNDFIVRKLEKLCTVKDISAKKIVSGSVNFSLWESFNVRKCGIILFVQNNSLHIFGSQSIQLPNNL